ncbi:MULTISPECIES: TetR/AcrR family transcriptional regulator [unclassified Sphingobium]|uniref:TetR/AcrR family transcriptional regulator n=1 Tax=unclassified Sphingobium TaxID=2611147 RepID=UPI0019180581|nr:MULTISPECIES: TetR/AcrR family transcriptional regulator [unclassified Sphingobium]CAD7337924.1 hypothetical protein SPHS8_01800 [Sphingobium sp. S8]CAD7339038.1 hypothetical protein SPHS6_02253 [Sphingobium sp. S6]
MKNKTNETAAARPLQRRGRAPKTGNGERRFEDIVLIAGELFSERGFNGTSLNDIADAVGVLKGSLYHYISSKEDLLYEVIKVGSEGLAENMRLCDHFASSPAEQLIAFCYGHIVLNAVPDRIHRGIVIIQDAKHLAPDKREQIFAERDAYQAYLRSIISRGMAANIFDAGIDQRISSFTILGVITSYIRWYKPGGPITPHDLARDSAAFVIASLQPQSPGQDRFALADRVIAQIQALQEKAGAAS